MTGCQQHMKLVLLSQKTFICLWRANRFLAHKLRHVSWCGRSDIFHPGLLITNPNYFQSDRCGVNLTRGQTFVRKTLVQRLPRPKPIRWANHCLRSWTHTFHIQSYLGESVVRAAVWKQESWSLVDRAFCPIVILSRSMVWGDSYSLWTPWIYDWGNLIYSF